MTLQQQYDNQLEKVFELIEINDKLPGRQKIEKKFDVRFVLMEEQKKLIELDEQITEKYFPLFQKQFLRKQISNE